MPERASEFADSPKGWAERWDVEFAAAKKFIRPFHKEADKCYRRFTDDRKDQEDKTTRLNLFHSNVTTLQSMLYGRIPKVDVDRRHADQNDDIARVAAVMLQRILNTDIEDAGEDYSYVLRSSLFDRLVGGMGNARCRYDFNESTKEIPPKLDPITGAELAEGYTEEVVEDEWVDVDYMHWKDVLWSPCRTWAEMRWRAYRVYMTRDELISRFGAAGKLVPLNSKGAFFNSENSGKKLRDEVWDQCEVWEIWDKQNRKVFWYVEGHDRILDMKDDFLRLEGFYPEPPPMCSNVTTNKYLPKPDFCIAQDLYNEIDILETRINLLTDACKAVGVYDKQNDGVQRLLNEGIENQLIPVDNWAAFAEKGGLKGVVDWLPIEQVAKTIDILSSKRDEKINLLYQVTGMADILRGASDPRTSATAEAAKAKFASIRVQALQDEFSRFASDLMRIKAEIISKHYQPYCIRQQSNIDMTPDAEYADAAIQLIKDPKSARWKIMVKSESMAMVDYAQLKQDRSDYITALATFMQSAAPLVELDEGATGPLLELLKWGLAGFKGSNEIEGVMDRAIADFQAKQKANAGKPKQDPETIKAQAEIQKVQMEMENDKLRIQMEMQQSQQEHACKMQEMQYKHQIEMEKLRLEMQRDHQKERDQAEFASAQAVVESAAQVEVAKNQPKKETLQ